jgi:hypothetical protein
LGLLKTIFFRRIVTVRVVRWWFLRDNRH